MPMLKPLPLESSLPVYAALVSYSLPRDLNHNDTYYDNNDNSNSNYCGTNSTNNSKSLSDHERDPLKPIDECPLDPRLIRQKLLQLQEIQQREKRQQEQRRMQAFRIKKFSQDSSNIADLDYRSATTIFKEGFQEHWGDPIMEHQAEKAKEDLQEQLTHNNIAQQDDHDVEVAGSDDEHDDSDRKVRRQQQRQQEQEMMETDSAMETDKTGDGDGDEEMEPHTRLQRARKAKEDAMRDYEEASRTLLRAKEREQAILYEYEADLIEVEVESSVSQQLHRHPGGHGLGHLFQNYSPLIQQQRQQQEEQEERGRLSSPITTAAAAAAAAAVAFQNQDDNNNEGVLNSQIVPQASDTPSVFSETPQVATALTPLLPVLTPSGSGPRRNQTPMTTTTTENQVPNRTRSESQVRSRKQSETSNKEVQPISPPPPQLRHHSNSPRIKIKSEEQDESFLKKYFLSGGSNVTVPDGDSKRQLRPRYEDFDITIEIPSSVGSSDVGLSGQPESSNAQDRGKQKEYPARQLPDRWRAPTPLPPSMRAKREATAAEAVGRPQRISWESMRSNIFGPGGSRTAKE
ncbi:hypothetical protein BGZ96_010052 [Linnemannia gamsii]|uniref:Uncharacterized protein n=1 Tax=Linnemannia gamsii TaxID=64522 RepID=A0ABQ7JVW3_9FUNG|nr:hypothetical protein BGZ96_010052 [Linnemannia gamsii]